MVDPAAVEVTLKLLRALPDPLLVTDSAGRVRWCNGQAAALLGQTAAALEGRELSALPGAPSTWAPRVEEVRRISLRHGSWQGLLHLGLREGTEVLLQTRTTALPTPVWGGEELLWTLAVARAEEAVQGPEGLHLAASPRLDLAPLQALLEHSPDIVSVLDEHGQPVFQTPAARRIHGHTLEDFRAVGDSLAFAHPDDQQRVREAFARLWAEPEQVVRLTYRFRIRDGSYIWLESVASNLLRHPAIRGLVVHSRDVSEAKRIEQTLREQEARLRLILDNMVDGICQVDAEGRFSWVSPSLGRLLGQQPETLLGQPAVDGLHPEDLARVGTEVAQALEARLPSLRLEYRYRHQAGHFLWFESVATMLWNERCQFVGGVFTTREIGERKRIDADRARLEEQLRQAVKMEAVGRLAGGVAHDFNNLLTGIRGYAELAQLAVTSGKPVAGHLREIQHGADRAAELTGQLLAFSRKQLVSPVVVDLGQAVDQARRLLDRIIGEDIELRFSRAEEPTLVRIDPGQVEQLLLNLAANARDAMPGGGALTIRTEPLTLREPSADRHVGEWVQLTIADTGHGMDEEVRRHLFEPFFTTKPTGQGTGLGLATVYGIVQQNGGIISVQSAPGQGTTFVVQLPRVERAEKVPEVIPPSPAREGGEETLLLAEDEPMVRQLAQTILELHGYHVLVAAAGDEALLLAEAHPGEIALLVTDVIMPGMNGRQLYNRLTEQRRALKVLYVSGYDREVIARQGVLDPDVNFLQKPFTVEELLHGVRLALSR